MAKKYIAKDFYTYVASLTGALNAASNAVASVTIEADSDFYWQNATFTCYDAATQTTIVAQPNISVMIIDQATGRQLMSQAVSIGDIAGNGNLPFILPQARIFNSRGTIQVNFYNNSQSNYAGVALNFTGTKMFF